MTDSSPPLASPAEQLAQTGAALAAELSQLTEQAAAPDLWLAEALDRLQARLKLDYAQIYLTTADGHTLERTYSTRLNKDEIRPWGPRLPLDAGSACGLAAARRQTLFIDDLTLTPFAHFAERVRSHTRAELAVPLSVGSRVVGVLDLHSNRPAYFTSEHGALTDALAGLLALTIDNARLAAEADSTRRAFENTARRLTRTDWQGFLDAIRYREQIGYTLDHSPTLAEPVVVPLMQPLSPTSSDPAILARPLEIGHATLGALHVTAPAGQRWSAADTHVVEATVRQLTQHLENLRLLGQAEQYQAEAEQATRRLTRQGWEEFFNAIDRDEQLGYTYDQTQLEPLAGPLSPIDDPLVLSRPVRLAGETLGELQIEKDAAQADRPWAVEQISLIDTVLQRAAQQVENLRLLAQAERYRQEAEAAARRLTHTAWEDYLQTPNAPAAGYVYDQRQVRPLETPDAEPAPLRAPLKARDSIIGELALALPADDPRTTRMVGAVADRLSRQIESLRLLEETERARAQLDRRAAELETVAQVSTAAARLLDPRELLQTVVDLSKARFNLYHAHIYRLNARGDLLGLAAGAGQVGRDMLTEGHAIPFDREQSLVARAARTRLVVIVNDVAQAPDFLPNPLLPATRSEMAVPMVVGDRLIGVFDVQADAVNRFTEEESRTYTTLAAQVAVALQNAELYAEQKTTVARLRELDQLKTSFLANMSHELRTPLNSILGFAQVILEELDGPITELMAGDLGLIEKNGQHLLALINDILDMAKIEAGRVSLHFEALNPHEVLQEVFESSQSLARNKALYLKIDSESAAGLTFTADRMRLRQVMLNLVSNAMKFTEQGGLTVRIVRAAEAVQLQFRDTGIGIPPNKLENIFEAFSQVDTSTTRKAGGTGLGLPISRRLVELHGGRLWAESSGIYGEGSTFYLELPINPPTL